MKKAVRLIFTGALAISIMLSGCTNSSKFKNESQSDTTLSGTKPGAASSENSNQEPQTSGNDKKSQIIADLLPADLDKLKPNEAGKIMVVMFHNFVETFNQSKSDKGEYTTTYDSFRALLPVLYEKGYRLVNLNDYLNNNISVPAGYIPMVFTFDDGTAGQFNLTEENGRLVANKQSAVGILEEFNKLHPDFGLKGTFYVNLGLKTFDGKGTVTERLKYLTDKGFEIGNHTYTHVSLPSVKTNDKIQQEVGENQKKMHEMIPGYNFTSLALPFGQASKDLQGYVVKGEFQSLKYENRAVMLVGANPTFSPVSKKFNPLATARVRSSGIKPVECDLEWWIKNMSKGEQYISDGNPNTITVPKTKTDDVDSQKLKDKKLVTY